MYPVDSRTPVNSHNLNAAGHPSLTLSEPLMRFLSASSSSVPLRAVGRAADEKIKVLIIDGQNNHNWQQTTPVLKKILEGTERFTVDVATSPPSLKLPALPKDATPEQKKDARRDGRRPAEDAQGGVRQVPPEPREVRSGREQLQRRAVGQGAQRRLREAAQGREDRVRGGSRREQRVRRVEGVQPDDRHGLARQHGRRPAVRSTTRARK